MKSDLRNLADAQQQHFAASHRYASSISDLRLRQSTGVQPITIRVTGAGWRRREALLDARFDRGIANSVFLTMVMLTITAGP